MWWNLYRNPWNQEICTQNNHHNWRLKKFNPTLQASHLLQNLQSVKRSIHDFSTSLPRGTCGFGPWDGAHNGWEPRFPWIKLPKHPQTPGHFIRTHGTPGKFQVERKKCRQFLVDLLVVLFYKPKRSLLLIGDTQFMVCWHRFLEVSPFVVWKTPPKKLSTCCVFGQPWQLPGLDLWNSLQNPGLSGGIRGFHIWNLISRYFESYFIDPFIPIFSVGKWCSCNGI